jgi:hypothetical protein
MEKEKELFVLALKLAEEHRKLQMQMASSEYRLRELLRFIGAECRTDMTNCLKMWEYYQRENTVSSTPINGIEDLYEKMVNREKKDV